jgi:Amt family ammonium transporter
VGLLLHPDSPAGISYEKSGLFYGGGVDQLWRQAVGALAVLLFSGILTFVIGFLLHKTIGFRVSAEDELEGVDSSEHAETGYDLGTLSASLRGVSFGGSPKRTEDGTRTKTDEEVSA